MKKYQQIQLLIEDLLRNKHSLKLEIESCKFQLGKQENIVTSSYMNKCLTMLDTVERQIKSNRSLLQMQGFDFGLTFEKSEKDIRNFLTWIELMTEEVK